MEHPISQHTNVGVVNLGMSHMGFAQFERSLLEIFTTARVLLTSSCAHRVRVRAESYRQRTARVQGDRPGST